MSWRAPCNLSWISLTDSRKARQPSDWLDPFHFDIDSSLLGKEPEWCDGQEQLHDRIRRMGLPNFTGDAEHP